MFMRKKFNAYIRADPFFFIKAKTRKTKNKTKKNI